MNKKENSVLTEEIFFVSGKNFQFKQESIHEIGSNYVETVTRSGPLKGSKLKFVFEPKNSGTLVLIHIELKLCFKYLLFSRFIKNKYRLYLEHTLDYVNELCELTSEKSWNESISDHGNCLTISKHEFKNIKLFGWWKSEINEIFNQEIYKFLPVSNKIVVDIGANICDSAIYFSKKNATKIIAIEPFSKNFNYAQKNIRSNNLSEKIELIQAACSNEVKNIKIDDTQEGTGLHVIESKNGIEIQTTTLEKIINDYKIDSAILKMDCEDCEYESILSSSEKTINSFSHIMIEYHHGYENLKTKLEKCNFHVSVKQSGITKTKNYGYIYCTKI